MKIAIVGLGYVGLPLATEFGKVNDVVGFDMNKGRIAELSEGRDSTEETTPEELSAAKGLVCTSDKERMRDCEFFIVCVPTPVDQSNIPDMRLLVSACATVGSVMKKGAIVVFESTVYPGATEEVCVPELERASGMKFNVDFFAGYSPERINPGDKEHRLPTIKKVTSGSTPEVADKVDALYGSIIVAGTHKAPSIKVAEAAKVIENTQRDVNIALMNELSVIFERVGIDTGDVLDAAGTKWNFLKFKPGLVGGHCIGVDPYYLTHKAQALGLHPEVILSGRHINDSMGEVVARRVVKLMARKGIPATGSKVLMLGLTFKENCPDIRNTKVPGIIHELEAFGCKCDVCDPRASAPETRRAYGIDLVGSPAKGEYAAIVIAVAHNEFRALSADDIHAFGAASHVVFDVKGILPKSAVDARL